MASLTLTDQNGKTLLDVPLAAAGLGKYLKSVLALRSVGAIEAALAAPLTDAIGSARALDFTVAGGVEIGAAGELAVAAGAAASVDVHGAGDALFAKDHLQGAVVVPAGTTYVSLALGATAKAGAGGLGFGFDAGGHVGYAYHHAFNTAAGTPSLGAALATTFGAAVMAGDADDVAALPVGAFVSLSGAGRLTLIGSAALSSTANLLATPGLPFLGTIAAKRSATVSLDAAWEWSGDFELRVSRPASGRVVVAYHKRTGGAFSVGVKATAGLAVTVKDSDLIAKLVRSISPDPEADLIALVNAGLTDAQINSIQQAIAASIDRSLTLAAQLQLSSTSSEEALFAYDIDPNALDAAGRDAVGRALRGDLSAIEAQAAAGGPGIRVATAASGHLRERKTTWRLNFLGILNAASISELVTQGTMTFDPVSGALNVADQVTGKRIRVETRPLESDPTELRRVVFESLIITAAYHASQAVPAEMSLSATHTYVDQRGDTPRRRLLDHYRVITALGLCDTAERDARLGAGQNFGATTFLVECRLEADACESLFVDRQGQAYPVARYERIARQAFLAVLPPDDPDRAFRRWGLERDAVWNAMRRLSDTELAQALPTHIVSTPLRLNVIRSDYLTIVWWAKAMAGAAATLLAVRQFIAGRDAASLPADAEFGRRRAALEEALASVTANTREQFGDPWDVVAIDGAASGTGVTQAIIVSEKLSATYATAGLPPSPRLRWSAEALREGGKPCATSGMAALRTTSGVAQPFRAAIRSATVRAWTDAERAILDRHVVNLREGALSQEGAFASSEDQVRRIFTEHLPAAIAARRAPGDRQKIVFYAHGGLVEELEGLLPVLATDRFWRMNGIYPIYFVWETGLWETVKDILLDAIPRRATRGPLRDAAIEQLARPGGQAVWAQMKTSAQRSVKAGGGARLVADLARDLWKDHADRVELHAIGHSAGSIFHSFFLPDLLDQQRTPAAAPPIALQSLHFLAPAATIALFKQNLKPLVGAALPIRALTMYTMSDELEQIDPSTGPYGKSLLYLVSHAFEDDQPAPILGMQRALKRDLDLIRFFGLAGHEQVAEVLFSKTTAGASARSRTESASHGGFDNDVATMTSVARRILAVPDGTTITDYAEDVVNEVRLKPDPTKTDGTKKDAMKTDATKKGAKPALPAPARPGRSKWTVLVWMAGDNDLETFGDKDLAEIKKVASSDDLDLVVQFDSMRANPTRRYRLRAGTPLGDDVVQELAETNTGDPAVAIDFFTWGMSRYPSERVLAVIWNHGSGIDETDIYARAAGVGAGGDAGRLLSRQALHRAAGPLRRRPLFDTTVHQAIADRAIAYDDTSRDFLDNLELQRVLAEVKRITGRTIDLLGFDACLMNMVEIAYQLRSTTEFIVGSEEVEPGNGWPYDRVLQALKADLAQDPHALGETVVNEYVASYKSESVTQSLLQMDRVGAAARAVDVLARELVKAIAQSAEFVAVSKALNATQRFEMPDFVDLGNFSREVARRTGVAVVKAAANATLNAIGAPNGLVAAERHKGQSVAGASGAAIYFPRGAVSTTYARLDFAKDTRWGAFLDAFHQD